MSELRWSDRLLPSLRAATRQALPASLLAMSLIALVASPAAAQSADISEDQKVFYFLGVVMAAQSLDRFQLTDEEAKLVVRGLGDQLAGRAESFDPQVYGMKAQELMRERMNAAASQEKQLSAAFLEAEAAKPGATRTDSGIVIQEMKAGTGASPAASDTVVVHYHGTLRDGTTFDSSVERGEPFRTELTRVIPCWTQAVTQMKAGGKSRIVCPSGLAYGDNGSPPKIAGGAALVFEVELIEVVKAE